VGKSRTTINAGTFPGPSTSTTTPESQKTLRRPVALTLCFLGGFSSCRHNRSRLQYGKTLQLFSFGKEIATLRSPYVRTSNHTPPPIRPSGRSLDYHSRNLPAGRGRASARRPRVPNNQSNSDPIHQTRPQGWHWLGGRTGIQLWGWQIGGVLIKFFSVGTSLSRPGSHVVPCRRLAKRHGVIG